MSSGQPLGKDACSGIVCDGSELVGNAADEPACDKVVTELRQGMPVSAVSWRGLSGSELEAPRLAASATNYMQLSLMYAVLFITPLVFVCSHVCTHLCHWSLVPRMAGRSQAVNTCYSCIQD